MIDRYKNTGIGSNKGKRSFKTTILPNIAPDISDMVIITKAGDRLDILAQVHYGDSNNWWIIAEANGLGKGSLFVPVGMQIRIPKRLDLITEKMDKISKGR